MPVVAKSPPEEKLLRALWAKGPLTRGQARADADTVRRLIATNLVEELPPSRKRAAPKLALTDAGRDAASKLPPAKPTQADLFRQLAALREELADLRQFVTARLGAGPPAPEPPAAAPPASEHPATPGSADSNSLDHVGKQVREAVIALDRTERLGGLVPIPQLRRALRDTRLHGAAFDDTMLALEEQFVIDLKVANDPHRLDDCDEGIDTPGRGLLYFVVAR